VSPSNATNKDYTWSSNNNAVATVNNGTVTAHAEGMATITVTTADGGKTAQCTVTVVNRFAISFEQITDAAPSIDGPTIYLPNGTATLSVTESLYDPGSIKWYITGTKVTGDGPTFTLSAANPAYNTPGEQYLSVEVAIGGVPYSKTVIFTVSQ
jgi:hypothetical protein